MTTAALTSITVAAELIDNKLITTPDIWYEGSVTPEYVGDKCVCLEIAVYGCNFSGSRQTLHIHVCDWILQFVVNIMTKRYKQIAFTTNHRHLAVCYSSMETSHHVPLDPFPLVAIMRRNAVDAHVILELCIVAIGSIISLILEGQ